MLGRLGIGKKEEVKPGRERGRMIVRVVIKREKESKPGEKKEKEMESVRNKGKGKERKDGSRGKMVYKKRARRGRRARGRVCKLSKETI